MQSKSSVEKLSKILCQRYEKRNGGYSRVIRAGFRYGDDAPMAIIELVDRDVKAKIVDVNKTNLDNKKTTSEDKSVDTDNKAKTKK